jgi:hypothetical protein
MRFNDILPELALKIDFPGSSDLKRFSQYLAFIIPRILVVLNPTIGMADSRNTEFAIWCAKIASREVG